jgi:hypothetical protein
MSGLAAADSEESEKEQKSRKEESITAILQLPQSPPRFAFGFSTTTQAIEDRLHTSS